MSRQSAFAVLIQGDPDGKYFGFEAASLFAQEAVKTIPARNRSTGDATRRDASQGYR